MHSQLAWCLVLFIIGPLACLVAVYPRDCGLAALLAIVFVIVAITLIAGVVLAVYAGPVTRLLHGNVVAAFAVVCFAEGLMALLSLSRRKPRRPHP